jgi:hypothetical protein
VGGVALTLGDRRQVTGRNGHGSAVSLCVSHDGVAAVIGRLKPLVTIRGPRVRIFG